MMWGCLVLFTLLFYFVSEELNTRFPAVIFLITAVFLVGYVFVYPRMYPLYITNSSPLIPVIKKKPGAVTLLRPKGDLKILADWNNGILRLKPGINRSELQRFFLDEKGIYYNRDASRSHLLRGFRDSVQIGGSGIECTGKELIVVFASRNTLKEIKLHFKIKSPHSPDGKKINEQSVFKKIYIDNREVKKDLNIKSEEGKFRLNLTEIKLNKNILLHNIRINLTEKPVNMFLTRIEPVFAKN